MKKVMGLFIIAIMLLSTLALVVIDFAGPSASTIKYGDYKFRIANGQNIVKIDGVERSFAFFPGDIEYVQVPDEAKTLLSNQVLTVSYEEGNMSGVFAEAQYYVEYQLDTKVIERAVSVDGYGLPVKTCADATASQPVIFFKENDSGISVENNCIIISAYDAYDLLQQVERLLYIVLGVMQ